MLIREQVEQRLRRLQAGFESGQSQLAELDARQTSLRETMLRISGAIQVLQEVLAASSDQSGAEAPAPENTTWQQAKDVPS